MLTRLLPSITAAHLRLPRAATRAYSKMFLHEELGCKLPLFGAAMAGASGGQLAAEVIQAGGFGFINHLSLKLEDQQKQVDIVRRVLDVPDGRIPRLGVGYLCWRLEKLLSEEQAIEFLRFGTTNASGIWLSFGGKVEKWVKVVRELGGYDVKIFVVVSTLQEAIDAASWGVDVEIVQGIEAGGHAAGYGKAFFSLFPQVAQHFRQHSATSRPRLIGAGGIVSPSQVAAALTLQDCEGVVLGTALLATSACMYSAAQKEQIAKATESGPRTMLWDQLRGTLDWPEGVDGRGLVNTSFNEQKEGVDIETLKARFNEAAKKGESDRGITWAGTSVGLVTDEPSVAKVIENIEKGAAEAIGKANALFKPRL